MPPSQGGEASSILVSRSRRDSSPRKVTDSFKIRVQRNYLHSNVLLPKLLNEDTGFELILDKGNEILNNDAMDNNTLIPLFLGLLMMFGGLLGLIPSVRDWLIRINNVAQGSQTKITKGTILASQIGGAVLILMGLGVIYFGFFAK